MGAPRPAPRLGLSAEGEAVLRPQVEGVRGQGDVAESILNTPGFKGCVKGLEFR